MAIIQFNIERLKQTLSGHNYNRNGTSSVGKVATMTEQELETEVLKQIFVTLGGHEYNIEAAQKCKAVAIQYADSNNKSQECLSNNEFWNWIDLNYERFLNRWQLIEHPEKGNWNTVELYEVFKTKV